MADFSHTIERGDSRTLRATATYQGSPYNLTGKTIWFTAKRSPKDSDDQAVIRKSTGSGIDLDVTDNNVCLVHIDGADTDSLTTKQSLSADIQVADGDDIMTVAKGILTVEPDVTRTTTP